MLVSYIRVSTTTKAGVIRPCPTNVNAECLEIYEKFNLIAVDYMCFTRQTKTKNTSETNAGEQVLKRGRREVPADTFTC